MQQFLDEPGAVLLVAALRASSTLTSLLLQGLRPLAAPVVVALLGGLVAHCSLRSLDLSHTVLEIDAAAGAALAALLAADAPALTDLGVANCNLGAAGLGALIDALPRNSHLRELDIRNNTVPAGFMRARLLPAVRGNTSLRDLRVGAYGEAANDNTLAQEEAKRIIAAR